MHGLGIGGLGFSVADTRQFCPPNLQNKDWTLTSCVVCLACVNVLITLKQPKPRHFKGIHILLTWTNIGDGVHPASFYGLSVDCSYIADNGNGVALLILGVDLKPDKGPMETP